MKRYASYKASGVAWLGDVPSHWVGKRLRDCVEGCSNGVWGDESDGGDDDIPVIRVADFDRESRQVIEYETVRKVDCSQRESRALIPGDMLIEKSGGGEQQPVGMVVSYFGPEGAVCSNFVARMRSREGVVSRFMVYLHAYLYASRVTGISVKQTTGIQNLNSTAYLSEACFVPPPDEQQAIADYLDTETARIDDLIREKEELIGLLREWRQSVIAEAVTKGLDKTAAMKPSGVPWLGDIPSHWDAVGMTKKIASIVDYRGKTPEKVDQGVFLVTAKNIREGFIDYDVSQEFVSVDDYEEVMRRGKPDIGDVLFTTEAPLGNVALVNRTDIALAQRVIKFKGIPQTLDNSFLMYWLLSRYMQEQLSSWSSGSTAEGIKSGRLVRLPLALPPFNEQQAIADYLDDETAKIDALITHTQEEIALLKELRAATIADAVLGRVDVRECQK